MCLKGGDNVPCIFVTPASSSSPGLEMSKQGEKEWGRDRQTETERGREGERDREREREKREDTREEKDSI